MPARADDVVSEPGEFLVSTIPRKKEPAITSHNEQTDFGEHFLHSQILSSLGILRVQNVLKSIFPSLKRTPFDPCHSNLRCLFVKLRPGRQGSRIDQVMETKIPVPCPRDMRKDPGAMHNIAHNVGNESIFRAFQEMPFCAEYYVGHYVKGKIIDHFRHFESRTPFLGHWSESICSGQAVAEYVDVGADDRLIAMESGLCEALTDHSALATMDSLVYRSDCADFVAWRVHGGVSF
jgi:hypothetical protein